MATTRRLNLDLSEEAADMVRDRVATGEYVSERAVIEDALRLLRQRDEDLAVRLDGIRERVRQSLEDGKPVITADEADRRMADFMDRQTRPSS